MTAFLERGGFDRSSALYKAAVRIQAQYRGYAVRKARPAYCRVQVLSSLVPRTELYVTIRSGGIAHTVNLRSSAGMLSTSQHQVCYVVM